MARNTKSSFEIWHRIQKSRFLNRYLLTIIAFLIWMIFFDKYNLRTQYKLLSQENRLEKEKRNYNKLIVQTIEDKKDLEQNIEKYAREKYKMHRSDEDLFVIDGD